jgi:hypothetical protein
MVGGVHLGPKPGRRGRDIQLASRASGTAFGISQSIYKGGAAWLAISGYGPDPDDTSYDALQFTSEVSQQHPVYDLVTNADQNLASLAAATCRPELALQLEAGIGGGRASRRILEIATEAVRLTPEIDLSQTLAPGQVTEFGSAQLPQPYEFRRSRLQRVAAGLTRSAQEPSPKRSGISAFIDGRRLQLDGTHILVQAGDKPARLVFADVPLRGNAALAIRATASAAVQLSLRAAVWDQTAGEEIAAERMPLWKGKPEITLPLHKIWGSAMIVIEFEGEGEAEVAAEIRLR